jgi:hypothetical protein
VVGASCHAGAEPPREWRGHAGEDARGSPAAGFEHDVDRVAVELGLEGLGRAAGDDPAVVDDGEVVGQVVGLLEIVGGQQDREPAVARQRGDLRPELGAGLGIEAGRRLVEEQHARVVDQPHRDVELAAHAARPCADEAVRGIGEGEALEHAGDPAAQLARPDAEHLALEDQVLAPVALGSTAERSRPRRSRCGPARGDAARRARRWPCPPSGAQRRENAGRGLPARWDRGGRRSCRVARTG